VVVLIRVSQNFDMPLYWDAIEHLLSEFWQRSGHLNTNIPLKF
jgi:hypothetical protein